MERVLTVFLALCALGIVLATGVGCSTDVIAGIGAGGLLPATFVVVGFALRLDAEDTSAQVLYEAGWVMLYAGLLTLAWCGVISGAYAVFPSWVMLGWKSYVAISGASALAGGIVAWVEFRLPDKEVSGKASY